MLVGQFDVEAASRRQLAIPQTQDRGGVPMANDHSSLRLALSPGACRVPEASANRRATLQLDIRERRLPAPRRIHVACHRSDNRSPNKT